MYISFLSLCWREGRIEKSMGASSGRLILGGD
jgi:hypothetical protein